MKILMLCTCGKKISLEKYAGTDDTTPGTFRATCRKCGTRHTITLEIKDSTTTKTRAPRHPHLLDFAHSSRDIYFPIM